MSRREQLEVALDLLVDAGADLPLERRAVLFEWAHREVAIDVRTFGDVGYLSVHVQNRGWTNESVSIRQKMVVRDGRGLGENNAGAQRFDGGGTEEAKGYGLGHVPGGGIGKGFGYGCGIASGKGSGSGIGDGRISNPQRLSQVNTLDVD